MSTAGESYFVEIVLYLSKDREGDFEYPESPEIYKLIPKLGEELGLPFIDRFLGQTDVGCNLSLRPAVGEEFHDSAIVRIKFF